MVVSKTHTHSQLRGRQTVLYQRELHLRFVVELDEDWLVPSRARLPRDPPDARLPRDPPDARRAELDEHLADPTRHALAVGGADARHESLGLAVATGDVDLVQVFEDAALVRDDLALIECRLVFLILSSLILEDEELVPGEVDEVVLPRPRVHLSKVLLGLLLRGPVLLGPAVERCTDVLVTRFREKL